MRLPAKPLSLREVERLNFVGVCNEGSAATKLGSWCLGRSAQDVQQEVGTFVHKREIEHCDATVKVQP